MRQFLNIMPVRKSDKARHNHLLAFCGARVSGLVDSPRRHPAWLVPMCAIRHLFGACFVMAFAILFVVQPAYAAIKFDQLTGLGGTKPHAQARNADDYVPQLLGSEGARR